MTALVFGKSKLARSYDAKSGAKMFVVPVMLLETGGLIECHFEQDIWNAFKITDDSFYTADNPVVCELTTEQRGLNNVIVNIEKVGILEWSVK